MVRLAEEVLVTRLGKKTGFRDPEVLTVDPAMGTGTYLHTILECVARDAASEDGPGAVAGAVTKAAERLVGFELQATAVRVAGQVAALPLRAVIVGRLQDGFPGLVNAGHRSLLEIAGHRYLASPRLC